MATAKLISAITSDAVGTRFETPRAEAPTTVFGDPRAAARADAANFESGGAWNETLQTAARLKLVLGPNRRVFTITGIDAADGGPLLAARLGAALAQIDHARVLVVEGHLASPTLADLFDVTPYPGFLDVLDMRADLKAAVRPVTPSNLSVLPLGQADCSLASLLTSSFGASIVGAIREQFRYVIVDAGIIRRDAGGMLLASLADGVVVAVARAARRRADIITLHEELQRLNIPLFGVVLTRVA